MDNISFVDKYLKRTVFFFLIIIALYLAKDFFVPVFIAALLSFLFLPLSLWLERHGMGKVISIIICLLIIMIFIFGLVFIFSSQLMNFADNMPDLENKARERFYGILKFIESVTSISYESQKEWFAQMNERLKAGQWIQSIFFATTNILLTMVIIVVYIFCFLFYRHKFSAFCISLFPQEKSTLIRDMMSKIQTVSSKYFSGVFIVMVILGTMHSIGLLLLGIEHAIFLGYLAGFFILVPVVGTIVGSAIPFVIALITKDSIWYALGVAGLFSFNLFIESQILTPVIVGSHIKINPMALIMAIVIGGFIWGLAGMVLFIPLVGILKILSDNIKSLNSLRILLSDDH